MNKMFQCSDELFTVSQITDHVEHALIIYVWKLWSHNDKKLMIRQ